jgi:hypothetical protein
MKERSMFDQAETTATTHTNNVRRWVGWITIGALILIFITTLSDESSNHGASAIQIIQIYTEGLFAATISIGICIASYVISRAKN